MLMSVDRRPTLYNRQKVLIALLQAFGGTLPNVDMQKYLFLFANNCELEPSYEFVPYHFGCFSFQSYADRRKLIEFGILVDSDGWVLTDDDEKLPADLVKKAGLFADKYRTLKGDELVRSVYRDYPYYAIHSGIASRLLTPTEMAAIEKARPEEKAPAFFTIGYEGQSFENYLNRLLRNNIQLLCDVRKNPLSRKYGFSKKTLSETLAKLGIQYLHFPELGIVSDKRRTLKTNADYQALFAEYEVTTLQSEQKALDRLAGLAQQHQRVAITCFEAEHCMCHRSKIACHLEARPDWHYPILHI
jgi:uncharacterized protein (DUF488 family)